MGFKWLNKGEIIIKKFESSIKLGFLVENPVSNGEIRVYENLTDFRNIRAWK